MEFGTIIGAAIFVAIAVFMVMQPFWARGKDNLFSAIEQKQRDELLTSYERILATIRDLDEDYNTGKLAPDSYQSERAYWTEQGISILQVLEPDNAEGKSKPVRRVKASNGEQADKVLDDAIEKAIADYRKAKV